MKISKPRAKRFARFSLSPLTIQQRLPLLICVLLLSVIVTFSWISYVGIKETALEVGRERLGTLTQQLSTILQQSARAVITATRTSANDASIQKFLQSGEKESDTAAMKVLEKLRQDTNFHLVQLLNA